MRFILIGAIALLFSQNVRGQNNKKIEMWAANLKQGEASPLFEVKGNDSDEHIKWSNYIFIQPDVTFQQIEGIGGAFNEIGGEALSHLKSKARKELMKNLFSEDGAGFSFCRTAIGASDFGLDAYSYSNVAEDYSMEHFSIDRDKKYVLPYIKNAFEVNPDLTLFASPWSPPAWMKESGKMTGLTEKANALLSKPQILEAYARYFIKYIQAYDKNGVFIDRICIQNENDANTKYPSCVFPAIEMVSFAKNYLIPAFKKNEINTKIYAGTFRAAEQIDLLDYIISEQIKGIEGVGIQYTNPMLIADAKSLRPDLKTFHTEGRCYNGKNSSEQAYQRLKEVASYINAGSSTFTYWNMILNETTKSGWDWPQNSLINIDRDTGTIQYNPDYNAMFIISKFIKPGDIRIASTNRGKYPMITVKSPNGTVKVLIQNTTKEDELFELHISNEIHKLKIPTGAITAISIK